MLKAAQMHTDVQKLLTEFTAVADTLYGSDYDHPPESQEFFRSVLRSALSQLAPPSPIRILEIGCGSGYWLGVTAAMAVADHLEVGLAGLDLTPALVERARLHLQDLPVMIELSVGDILAGTDPGRYHLCYAYDMVQQIDRRDHALLLERAHSGLEEGGVLVVFDRDPWTRYGIKMRVRKALSRHFGFELVPPHYLLAQYPAFSRLARLAARAGFAVIDDRFGASRRALVLKR